MGTSYNTTVDKKQSADAAGQGALTGALSGAATGATIGSAGTPIGTVIGGVIGAAVGAVSGAGLGAWQDDVSQQQRIKSELGRQKGDEQAKIDAQQAAKAGSGRTMLTAPTTAGVSNMSYMPGSQLGQTAYDSWKEGG